MELICTKENLNKAINIVGKIVNKNTTLPILNNILLKTEKNGLKLSSTNLEIGINCWIGGKIKEKGEITIPTKLFSNFVSNLPNGNIEMKLKNNVLNIKCNKYKTNIKGLDAKEYPLTPKIEADYILKIDSSKFKRALTQILPAVSNSESRIEITGILLDLSEILKNKLILVATDSYRLAEKVIKLDEKSINKEELKILGEIKNVIIPKNTIHELVRSISEGNNILKITISENQILFEFENTCIISRLIEGKYPNYKQVIPEKFKSTVVITVDDIINAIKVTSLFASSLNNNIELKTFNKLKSIEINAESNEIGSSNTSISTEIKGDDLSVIYNCRYLLDGLNSIIGDKAVLNINNEILPTVLSSKSDNSFLYVIMPVNFK